MNKDLSFIGIIPARFASTRFPGKPLAMLGGMTMIERVYRQVSKALRAYAQSVSSADKGGVRIID